MCTTPTPQRCCMAAALAEGRGQSAATIPRSASAEMRPLSSNTERSHEAQAAIDSGQRKTCFLLARPPPSLLPLSSSVCSVERGLPARRLCSPTPVLLTFPGREPSLRDVSLGMTGCARTRNKSVYLPCKLGGVTSCSVRSSGSVGQIDAAPPVSQIDAALSLSVAISSLSASQFVDAAPQGKIQYLGK